MSHLLDCSGLLDSGGRASPLGRPHPVSYPVSNNCDGGRCSLPHRAPRIRESTCTFDTTSMIDHNEEKRTKQNLIVRSRKPEAELALDVLYYWSYLQTWSITRPLCDSRAACSYMLLRTLISTISGRIMLLRMMQLMSMVAWLDTWDSWTDLIIYLFIIKSYTKYIIKNLKIINVKWYGY